MKISDEFCNYYVTLAHLDTYCTLGNFHEGFIFAKLHIPRKINLLFTDVAKSCFSSKFLMSHLHVGLLTPSQKFLCFSIMIFI